MPDSLSPAAALTKESKLSAISIGYRIMSRSASQQKPTGAAGYLR